MKKSLAKWAAVAVLVAAAAVGGTPKANAQMPTTGCYWDVQYGVGYVGPGFYLGRACYNTGAQISFTPYINVG